MAVKDILDSIENLVVESRRMPLLNKSLIDETDLIHLVDELRQELPLELQRAEKIMQDKQKILDDAQTEADKILEQAKEYAMKLTDENEIVVQAQEKAKTIMQQTQAQEKDIMDKTMTNAKQLRDDADQYANQVFDHLIDVGFRYLDGVKSLQYEGAALDKKGTERREKINAYGENPNGAIPLAIMNDYTTYW